MQRQEIIANMSRTLSCRGALILPKIFETRWRAFRIAHRVLNILVSKVRLEGTRIRAIVCQLEPASMPEHVWVDFDFKLGFFRRPLPQPCKPSCHKRQHEL